MDRPWSKKMNSTRGNYMFLDKRSPRVQEIDACMLERWWDICRPPFLICVFRNIVLTDQNYIFNVEANKSTPEVAQKRQYMNCAVFFKARRSRGVPVLKKHVNDKFSDVLTNKLNKSENSDSVHIAPIHAILCELTTLQFSRRFPKPQPPIPSNTHICEDI